MPRRAQKRLLLLDYDGTLVPQSNINSRPTEEVLRVLQALCADQQNSVYIISGRRKSELGEWFASVVRTPLHPFPQPRHLLFVLERQISCPVTWKN